MERRSFLQRILIAAGFGGFLRSKDEGTVIDYNGIRIRFVDPVVIHDRIRIRDDGVVERIRTGVFAPEPREALFGLVTHGRFVLPEIPEGCRRTKSHMTLIKQRQIAYFEIVDEDVPLSVSEAKRDQFVFDGDKWIANDEA